MTTKPPSIELLASMEAGRHNDRVRISRLERLRGSA